MNWWSYWGCKYGDGGWFSQLQDWIRSQEQRVPERYLKDTSLSSKGVCSCRLAVRPRAALFLFFIFFFFCFNLWAVSEHLSDLLGTVFKLLPTHLIICMATRSHFNYCCALLYNHSWAYIAVTSRNWSWSFLVYTSLSSMSSPSYYFSLLLPLPHSSYFPLPTLLWPG